MDLVKICPCCGEQNKPDEMMCTRCLNDISGIAAQNPKKPSKKETSKTRVAPVQKKRRPVDPEATVIERGANLIMVSSDGVPLQLSSGDVIGRKAKGEAIFYNGPGEGKTVSRKHARIDFSNGWTITDLNSGNGTFVNDMKLNPGQPHPVKSGDRISLSTSSVEFTVKI